MRVEVRHFAGDSYTVHYSMWWWWPFMTEWGKPDDANWTFPNLIRRKDVYLMELDEAKDLADSLTPQKAGDHERQLERAYEKNVADTKLRLAQRREHGFSARR